MATEDSGIQCDRSASDLSSTASTKQNNNNKLKKRQKLKPHHISTSPESLRPSSSRSIPSHRVEKRFPNGSTESLTSSSSSSASSHADPRSASHIACQLSRDYPGYFEYLRPSSVFRKPLRKSLSLPEGFKDSYKLQHPDLTDGDKEYLRHKAAVYSMTNMKKGAEWRFRQALHHQIDTGFHTRAECQKYFDYLEKPRKRQFGTDPRVWRNPPKVPPRPLHFHRRSATVPAGFERSQSAMQHRRGIVTSASSRRDSDSSDLPTCWKDTALYYDPETKKTIPGRKKPDPKPK